MGGMTEQHAFGVPQFTKGDRLAKALDFAGMSVADMADYLVLTRNTIGNYISMRTKIPGPALKLWAMRTGVPVEWIETGMIPQGGGGGASTLVRSYRRHRPRAA